MQILRKQMMNIHGTVQDLPLMNNILQLIIMLLTVQKSLKYVE